MVGSTPTPMSTSEGYQELYDNDSLLHGSLLEGNLPHTATALRPIRVGKIQCDKSKIICSTGGPTILGWDFADRDASCNCSSLSPSTRGSLYGTVIRSTFLNGVMTLGAFLLHSTVLSYHCFHSCKYFSTILNYPVATGSIMLLFAVQSLGTRYYNGQNDF